MSCHPAPVPLKEGLRDEYDYLISDLTVPSYLDALFAKRVISDLEKEHLRNERNRHEQARYLIDGLMRKSDDAIRAFVDIIGEKAEQPQIHKALLTALDISPEEIDTDIDREWEEVVIPRYESVVESLRPSLLLNRLQQVHLIDARESEELENPNLNEKKRSRKLLYRILPRKGKGSFKKFCDVLVSVDGQRNIVTDIMKVGATPTTKVKSWKDDLETTQQTVENGGDNVEPLRICITGAAGQVAYSLFEGIANGDVFGKDRTMTLMLLDIKPMIEVLKQMKMELMDSNLPLLIDVVTTADPDVAFMNVDVAILIGAKPRHKGMERRDLLGENAGIFMEQGKSLDKHAKKSVKVLVVGNPANTNCLITMLNAPSIPRENFTALSRLDQNRAVAMIAKHLNVTCNKIRNIIIWGNHSDTQYVDPTHAHVITDQGTQDLCSVVKDDAWLQGEFLQTVQERGAAVIVARNDKSSGLSAAKAICDHMHDWFSGTEPGKWISMGVTSGKYGIPEGLIYSYPVTVKNGQWSIVEGLDISPFSREKMNATMKELQEEREAASRFLPKVQLRVCITGAAGQVACSLFRQIAEGNVFGKDKPITLVLLDVESKIEDLYEIKTVLMECNLPLLTEVVTTADPDVAFMKVDVAILIGAKPREEGMERKDLLNVNGGIFMEQGKSLDKYAKKSVKVLVVGNPANTNCLITMLNAPSIPRENFTALTHLDQNRAQAMIAERLNVRCNKIKNIVIWGNHSNTQYVDPAHAYVITDQGKQGVCNAVKDDTWLQGEFLQTIQERGAAVIAARTRSSGLSAGNAICGHMRAWFSGTKPGEWTSMGVISGKYDVPEGLIYSYPVTTRNGEWSIVEGLEISAFSREKMNATAKELQEEREAAAEFMPKA